jgi:hypothetical protein
MNFLESVFQFAPDGGDGSFELVLITSVAAGLAAFVTRHFYKRLRSQLA